MSTIKHEHSADLADQGSEAAEVFLDVALQNQRLRSEPEQHPDFDGKHCVEPDCGMEIPAERLALRYTRCTDCQQLRELKAKQFQG